MNTIKLFPILLVFTSCISTPQMINYSVGSGVMHYFLSPTDWTAQGSRAKAQLDITYRTGTDTPAIINISFFGEKTMPGRISFVSLHGNNVVYPLDTITPLYRDPKKRILRISTEGNRDTLVSLLEAEPITLSAEIDGVTYTYTPSRHFSTMTNDFLIAISY